LEFTQLISNRYSVRSYKADAVEEDKLQTVLEAARLAPTAANRQPFKLLVLHTAGRETELGGLYHRAWFVQAPVLIIACGIPSQGWVRGYDGINFTSFDLAIAMDHLILAATNLGLGTCWIASFDAKVVRQILSLPDEVDPVVLTPLGYPADGPGAKTRKPLSDLVRYEKW
jgi:nitroreductase